jgi:integrase
MLPRVPRDELDYLKPSEINALLNASPEPERYLFAVLAYSGLRLGEALALRWRDIDFGLGTIRVQRAYSVHGGIQDPKTASSRRAVPLLPVLVDLLEPKRSKPDELLFSKAKDGKKKRPIDPDNARKVFNDAVKAAGLKHVTMHSLRHSYATVMIASGASIKALQRALGHASVHMTLNTYSHLLEESMEEPVLKADSLFRGNPK